MYRVRSLRPFLCASVAGLVSALGCVDHNEGGKTLYVFDNSTKVVQVWSDVSKVNDAVTAGGTVPAADRTITSTVVPSNSPLAWGGLTLDTLKNRLYLVSESGTVTVILKADTQNGSINSTTDTYSFTLGSGQHLSNAVFGQASVDFTTDTLFVQETTFDGSATRVWKVTNVSQIAVNGNADSGTFPPIGVSTDTRGAGVVAVPGGNAIVLNGGGNAIYDSISNTYTGARLRLSAGGVFSDPIPTVNQVGNVIIGRSDSNPTGLGGSINYGGVAFDSSNSLVFVAGANDTVPVLVFFKRAFATSPYNQAPASGQALGDTSLPQLRTITHGADSDWLLGANLASGSATSSSTGTGTGTLLIWKSPSTAGVTANAAALPGVTEIRGMAVGGGSD